jgi:SRSO17 transposase
MMPGRRCWRICWGRVAGCFPRRETRQSCGQQVLDIASAWAAGHLDGNAVLIMDGTADEKSSDSAVGAARQYSGTVGGIALCQ